MSTKHGGAGTPEHNARSAMRARFERLVDRSAGVGSCWLWTGTRSSDGYGSFSVCGAMAGAHRVAYLLARDSIPAGLCVCHRCDVKLCVNPAHLFVGTHGDNARDRDAKGRNGVYTMPHTRPRGEAVYCAKLTEAAVRDIRARAASSSATLAQFAKDYGVHQRTIQDVIVGKTWAHITAPESEAA